MTVDPDWFTGGIMISGKTILGAAALMAVTSSAHAAVSINFKPGVSGTNATVFQSFTTAASSGTPFVASPTPIVNSTFSVNESSTGVANTYQGDFPNQAVGPVVSPATGSFLSILNGSYTAVFTPGVQVLSFVFGGLDSSIR